MTAPPFQLGSRGKHAIDLVGVVVAGCRVVEQMSAVSNQSRWRIECLTCGHRFPVQTGEVRYREKLPPRARVWCPECRKLKVKT